MTQPDNRLARARIATPCPVSWESMSGNDEARFCGQCQLHVYDISRMTTRQAEALIARTEGRICARLYRRADGTVLTRDCPIGLRALRRRGARIASAVLTAILSLCASVAGQKKSPPPVCQPETSGWQSKIKRADDAKQKQEERLPGLSGVAVDPQGASVAGATVTLTNEETQQELKTVTDDEGKFHFPSPQAGSYTLKLDAPGFQKSEITHIAIKPNEPLDMELTVTITPGTYVTVGILTFDPLVDVTRPNGTTIITREMIDKLPYED